MLWSSHPHDKLNDKVYNFYFGDESSFMQQGRLELKLDRRPLEACKKNLRIVCLTTVGISVSFYINSNYENMS